MNNPSEIKSILFDLDGVIVDSISAWHSAFNRTLKHFGEESVEREEFIDRYWGREIEENMDRLGLGKEGAEYCRSQYEENIGDIRIYPGVKELLGSLDKRLGLVTSTPSTATRKILRHFDLEDYFDTVVSGDDVDKPKPSSQPVLKACDILDVEPENTIFIGDNWSDVRSGRKAGCRVIGVGREADFRAESPEKLEDKLSELNLLS